MGQQQGPILNILKTTAALAAITAGAAIFTCPANAEGWYGVARVGQTQSSVEGIDLSDGLAYGAAIGHSVGPFRVEAGVDHLAGDFGNVINADAWDYNASAFLDLNVGANSSVFVGAGADYIDGSASFGYGSIDASGTGYHWALGAAHRFSAGVVGEVQYRQINADLDTGYGSVNLDAQEITAGLRFSL